jgi:hypothetical protein
MHLVLGQACDQTIWSRTCIQNQHKLVRTHSACIWCWDKHVIKLFGHEPASKTNTSWLELILHAFGVGTSHGLIRTHMTHHGPDSGGATTILPIVLSVPLRRTCTGTFSWDSQGGAPKLSRVWTPRTLGHRSSSPRPPIGTRPEPNL